MNKILIIGDNNNDYLNITFNALNLSYNTIKNNEELKQLELKDTEYTLLIKSNSIIRREFNIQYNEILQHKGNLILGYNNFIGLDILPKYPNIFDCEYDTDTVSNKTFSNNVRLIENNIKSKKILNLDINALIISNNIINDYLENTEKDPISSKLFNLIFDYIVKKEKNLLYDDNFKSNDGYVFKNMTSFSYFKKINSSKDMFGVNDSNLYLFGELKKKDIVKSYYNNLDKIHNNIINLRDFNNNTNIYCNNIFNSNITTILIVNDNIDDIIQIIDNVSKSYINTFFNNIIFITDFKNVNHIKEYLVLKKKIKCKSINFIENDNNLKQLIILFNIIEYYKDIYILSSPKINLNFDNNYAVKSNFINQIIDYQNICIKFSNYFVKFFKLIPTIINKYFDEIKNGNITDCNIINCIKYIQKLLAKINITNFSQDSITLNIKYNTKFLEDVDITNFKLEFTEEFLEELYDKEEYDIIYRCIVYTFINKLPTDQSIVFKYLAITPNANYQFTPDDFMALLKLININNEIEIISIFNILFFTYEDRTFIDILFEDIKYNDKCCKNYISLYCILAYYSNNLNNVIDITKDIALLKYFIDNLKYIKNNFKGDIKKVNNTLDSDLILNTIFTFIQGRLNLLEQDYIDKFNINYYEGKKNKNINKMNDDEIYKLIKDNFVSSLNMTMSLSEVMMTTNDILQKREISYRYVKILKNIIDNEIESLNIKNVDQKTISTLINLFRYSYHGIPNKDFFKISKYCFESLFKIILKKINKIEINDLINDGLIMDLNENFYNYEFKDTNPKKILFISEFLNRNHSVFKDRHQVIKYLANNGFEVYLGLKNDLNYQFSNIFKDIKGKIMLDTYNVIKNVKSIRQHNFDKVIFCDVGMSSVCTLLAHFKLGRITFNTWGHSDTSGCKYIDYYVSSKHYELPYEQSKEHYSEELILQNGLCTAYVNPVKKYNLNTPRTYYGLSKYDKIILCPQSLFKIYPDYDEYLFEILYRLPDVNIVFVDAMNKKYKMYERWDNKMDKKYLGILSRVKFIPGVKHEEFVNLINNSDFMLDPYPFGGCNTSFEGFACDIPIVTQRANVINGRFTAGFYEYMGFTELIAKDKEDYINLCCKLINNKKFYNHCVKQIKENKHKLFMDQVTLDEWKELMETK